MDLRGAADGLGGRASAWRIDRGEPDYPPGVNDLADHPPGAPATLFGLGDRGAVAGLSTFEAVTVVGSRRASAYGREVAERLSYEMAAAGLIVVSGMAHGIDAAAHRGALDAGGVTIAVLGGGPDVVYPQGQRHLYRRIIESRGAVIAEAEPGTVPARWSFPARNRIMAAMTAVTVVVEATERSGTRITSDWALDLQRIVGAVPGPVTSRLSDGPNSLIVDGASPVRSAADVLDLFGGLGGHLRIGYGPPVDGLTLRVLEAVEEEGGTADVVALEAGLGAADVAVALTRLELLGYLRSRGPDRYTRTLLQPPDDQSRSLP